MFLLSMTLLNELSLGRTSCIKKKLAFLNKAGVILWIGAYSVFRVVVLFPSPSDDIHVLIPFRGRPYICLHRVQNFVFGYLGVRTSFSGLFFYLLFRIAFTYSAEWCSLTSWFVFNCGCFLAWGRGKQHGCW
jgi:hypothetical protein